ERVEIARVAVVPPMELQQVEAFDTHPRQRDPDRLFDNAPGHPSRIRHPLCERLDLGEPLRSVAGGEPAAEVADKILGRTIMVGEIPGGEPGIVVGEHLVDRAPGLDRAMAARDLPHAVQDPADREIGGELEAARGWERHTRYLGFAAVGFVRMAKDPLTRRNCFAVSLSYARRSTRRHRFSQQAILVWRGGGAGRHHRDPRIAGLSRRWPRRT